MRGEDAREYPPICVATDGWRPLAATAHIRSFWRFELALGAWGGVLNPV